MPKNLTRKSLREQRRQLTLQQQQQAAIDMARLLSRQLFFLRAKSIAFYLPNDGEIDPTFLLELAAAAGKKTFLPVLEPDKPGHLAFIPWQPGEPLANNRFGIPEPHMHRSAQAKVWTLDIICLPLVGFDAQGNRLGMGGGFYDRTFSNLARYSGSGPLLVGLAHQFQQVQSLPVDPWDIPLYAIATNQRVVFTHRSTPESTT